MPFHQGTDLEFCWPVLSLPSPVGSVSREGGAWPVAGEFGRGHASAMPCGQLALLKICVPDAALESGVEFRQVVGFQRSEEPVLLLKKILVSRQEHYSREGVRSYGRWMLYESGISVVVAAGMFGFGARAGWMAFLPLSGAVLVLLRWGLAFGLGPGSVTA